MKLWVSIVTMALVSGSLPCIGEMLRVKSQVTVSSDSVYLSDLLIALPGDISDFVVTRAPRVNQTKVIESSVLTKILSERYAKLMTVPEVDISIERAQQTVRGQTIDHTVRSYISQRWNLAPNARLTSRSAPPEMSVPTGRVDIQVTSVRPVHAAENFKAWVDVSVDDQWYQSLVLDYHLEEPVDVFATVKNLEAGDILGTGSVRTITTNRFALGCEPVTTITDHSSLHVDVPIGMPLCQGDLSNHYLVRKGESFSVNIGVGAVELEVRLIATSDAKEGEILEATRLEEPESIFHVVFMDGSPRLVNEEVL